MQILAEYIVKNEEGVEYMLISEKEVNYIKTVQNIKSFFGDFQQHSYIAGLLRPMIGSDGYLTHLENVGSTKPRHGKRVVLESQHFVNQYTDLINNMDELYRLILINYYVNKKRDVAISMEINYGIAQYKRIKKKAVIYLAMAIGVVAEKQELVNCD